jgi:hypothetical protein
MPNSTFDFSFARVRRAIAAYLHTDEAIPAWLVEEIEQLGHAG